jgi:hypothetical protein
LRLDLQQLTVPETARVLNSTPLGEVVAPRVVYRHLNRAGLKIGDGRTIHLVRYAAWLCRVRSEPKPEPGSERGDYEKVKASAAQRARNISEAGRDISGDDWVRPPKDQARKDAATMSFRAFCDAYFPQLFHLPWSEDHLRVMAKIERSVLEGELFAMAMPRGSGKTTLCEMGCLWAMMIGAHEFVVLIGSDESHAADMLDSIKSELENNDLLDEDWSEVTGPIRALEGIHQRAKGQLFNGDRTHIGWTSGEVVLPTVPGSMASGGIIRVGGITGRIRGMKFKRPDGRSVRPSLVLVDDPQTDESAKSPSQCATREAILSGAILGLAGPGKKIAGLMTVTVVQQDDMADRMLDRTKHPAWQGERTRMVYSFPKNEALWAKYFDLRRAGQAEGTGTLAATRFYEQNRGDMDDGSAVSWPARHDPGELSAIQHAMNIRCDRGDAAFYAEYQNEPLPSLTDHMEVLTPEVIKSKSSGHKRGVVPERTQHVTAFIDVQQTILYWMVCAWDENFGGSIIDYGTHPEQGRNYFTMRDAQRTIQIEHRESAFEANLYSALDKCVTMLCTREYRFDDGTPQRIARLMIDANWGASTDIVYQFCRTTPFGSIAMPSHGRYVGASSLPYSEYATRLGDRVGPNWRVPGTAGKRAVRHCNYDTNFWKSFAAARFQTKVGEAGCLTVFAGHDHGLLCDHLLAEAPVRTEARGRVVDEWKTVNIGQDNHWLDCLVGNCVAASMLGVRTVGVESQNRQRKKYGGASTAGSGPAIVSSTRKSYGSQTVGVSDDSPVR